MRRCWRLLAVFGLCLGALAAPAAGQPLPLPTSTPLVTITGQIARTNRGPYDESRDVYFKHLGLTFEKAAAFDAAMLAALAQHTVRADFPMGGRVRSFAGPRLADVLDAVGAAGTTATITALDGYAVEVPIADLRFFHAILATSEDGKPFGIGDHGPAWLIDPRLDDPALKERNDDNWVWAVVAIAVK